MRRLDALQAQRRRLLSQETLKRSHRRCELIRSLPGNDAPIAPTLASVPPVTEHPTPASKSS